MPRDILLQILRITWSVTSDDGLGVQSITATRGATVKLHIYFPRLEVAVHVAMVFVAASDAAQQHK